MLKRLLVIALVGLVVGVLAVAILSALYTNSRAVHNVMSPAAYGVTSVVVFFLAFGITVLVLALTFVSRDEWADLLATGNDKPGAGTAQPRRSSAPEADDFEPEEPAKSGAKTPAQATSKLGTATAAATNPKAVPTPQPKPAQSWTGTRRDDPQNLGTAPPPMASVAPKPPSVEPIDAAKNDAAKMMELSIAGLGNFGLKIDDRTRLGCALYLAGAAEALAEKHALKEGEALSVVESCIDLLGGGPTFSEAFAKQYLEQLKNKDNAAIFGAGRSAIQNPVQASVPEARPEAAIDLGDFPESGASQVEPATGKTADVLAQPELPPPAPPVPSLPGLAIALDAWLGDDPSSSAQAGEAVLVAEMEAPPKPEAQDTTSLNRMEVSRRVMRRALRTTGGIALKQSWGGIVASFPNPPMRFRRRPKCSERLLNTPRSIRWNRSCSRSAWRPIASASATGRYRLPRSSPRDFCVTPRAARSSPIGSPVSRVANSARRPRIAVRSLWRASPSRSKSRLSNGATAFRPPRPKPARHWRPPKPEPVPYDKRSARRNRVSLKRPARSAIWPRSPSNPGRVAAPTAQRNSVSTPV